MSFENSFRVAGNDYDGALERAAGDEALLGQLMTMFLSDRAFESLTEALYADDCKAAFAAAHSLKGSSGMLGMTALFDVAAKMTEYLRAGMIEPAKAMFPLAKKEYFAVTELIKGEL